MNESLDEIVLTVMHVLKSKQKNLCPYNAAEMFL